MSPRASYPINNNENIQYSGYIDYSNYQKYDKYIENNDQNQKKCANLNGKINMNINMNVNNNIYHVNIGENIFSLLLPVAYYFYQTKIVINRLLV